MLNFNVRMDDPIGTTRVQVAGMLDVHNATEFSHMVHQVSEAAGTRACYDFTELDVVDSAGWAAVRTFVRDAQEYGGDVRPPANA
ncbi:hypothetical protein GCM10023169_21420 [Georgenia halophila]|uniref:STAS domain-containing protein n=1 Tax=Georgenia halophila TaxID=620889 RepID=A0ABP8L8L4_9MICO